MYLDIFLIVVMLISGMLAMVRGFMREFFSIMSWATAAGATVWGYSRLLPTATQYFDNEWVAKGAVIAGTFLGTLIVISIITIRISDKILDSRIGALDRTLGFLFGLGRGFIIVVVAFVFFDWLVPQKSQPEAIQNAKSRIVLRGTGDWMMSLLPENLDSYISNVIRKKPKDDDRDTPDTAPNQKSEINGNLRFSNVTGNETAERETIGYDRTDRLELQNLLLNKAAATR